MALADIIEGFRRSFQGIYGIDLLHNLTLPKASWVGMLKSTKVHIELVTDQELYDDIEAGIRGGVCVPYQSHAVANDPRVQETTEPHSFIGYWDANSLYPWAMMQRLPIRGYKRYECDDMDGFLQARLRDYDEDAPVSWYFVVDMMVPDHLHDTLDLAPTRKGEIDGVVKLFPYLGEQTEYRAHLSLLVAYHRQGVVFTKVHRIWQYEQTRWLKPILEDLAARRAAAKSESMKAACKLSANALYGMTILNKKDWRSWVLYTDEDRWESDVARLYEPGCRTWVHYNNEDDGCFLSFRERRVGTKGVCLDSARLVGSAVLDHSKVRMWNFHYDCMKKICRPLLLYQDTDSFVYLIPGSCPYELMRRAPEWFDFKNGKDLGWVANENSGKPGYFKYEFIHKGDKNDPLNGQMDVALEYAGSEAKVYAMRLQTLTGEATYLRCKGCPQPCG
ncbi:MAG UNVERIFIED_CONTAM: DNA polymerase [Microcystis novacekii LVE1205-3]